MQSAERLKGIDVFVCAAEAGSFTAAAERLRLTNSAVGKAVGRLEQRLGVRLFHRTTRAMMLTDAGAAYYDTCVRVLAELDDATAVLAAQRLEPVGRLRVDAGATFGRLKVLPLLIGFARRHPNLRPHLSLTDRFVDLIDEGIDVAVRIGGPAIWPAALGYRLLATERLVFCAAPAYLAERGTPRSVVELMQHDAVVYGKADGSADAWSIETAEARAERSSSAGQMIIGNAEAQVDAVRAGCGVAQLATWLIDDELSSGGLVQILPERAIGGLPLYLVWQKSRQLQPKVAAFLELLASSLEIG